MLKSLYRRITSATETLRTDSWSAINRFANSITANPNLYDGRSIVTRFALAHRVVWSIPQDCLSKGWQADSGQQQDFTRDFDITHALEQKLLLAHGGSRQDGVGWLWMVSDGEEDKEFIIGVNELLQVHPLSKSEVMPSSELDIDPKNASFGQPLYYTITPRRNGLSGKFKVHNSKMVRIGGALTTTDTPRDRDADVPILQLYIRAIESVEDGWYKVARLLDRLSMFWVRMKDGVPVSAAEGNELDAGEDTFSIKLSAMKTGMEKGAMIALFGEDEVGWSGPSLGGVRDAMNILYESISAVEGLSLAELFGQAPGGLSTDDESGQRNKASLVERERRTRLTPALTQIYRAAFGDVPVQITWPSLETQTTLEEAQTSLTRMQRDSTAVMAGILQPEESRARFLDGEESALPVVKSVDLPIMPSVNENELPPSTFNG